MNHHMILHVHKGGTDAPTIVDVADDFVWEKENRKQLFGKFCANDIANKFFISSKLTQMENSRTKGIVDKCRDLTCTK